jgi:polyketide synthase 12/myxalamid-type polyketide synthase MxaB
VGWINPDHGLQTLEQLLSDARPQAGVLPIDWPKFFQRIPAGSEPAWLSELAREARAAAPAVESGPPVLLEKLKEVTPAERLDVAQTHIRQQAARVLAMAEGELPDPRRPLNELGFDSLTAVEFCNRVGRSIGQHLNPTLLFDYPTLELLSGYVVRDVLHLETQAAAEAEPAQPSEAVEETQREALEAVEEMSEAEMNALVAQQLDKLQS